MTTNTAVNQVKDAEDARHLLNLYRQKEQIEKEKEEKERVALEREKEKKLRKWMLGVKKNVEDEMKKKIPRWLKEIKEYTARGKESFMINFGSCYEFHKDEEELFSLFLSFSYWTYDQHLGEAGLSFSIMYLKKEFEKRGFATEVVFENHWGKVVDREKILKISW